MEKSRAITQRETPRTILHRHANEVAAYALCNWTYFQIFHALVRDHGVGLEGVEAKDVKMFMSSDEIVGLKEHIFDGTIVAIQDFKSASEEAVDTSKERIELASLQKLRIQKMFAKEIAGGHVNKAMRQEMKLLSDILTAEDKKREKNDAGDMFGGWFGNASSKAQQKPVE